MTQITRPVGTLKKLVDVGKKETRVVGSVERWILARPADNSRATNVIHPSAMIKPDWCHRAEYYHLQGAEPAPPKYRSSMKTHLTFEEGHRIHARWQTWFRDMGKLYGQWKCLNCGYIHKGKTPPENCPVCKKPFTWYMSLGLIR
jgi:rubrerythrin